MLFFVWKPVFAYKKKTYVVNSVWFKMKTILQKLLNKCGR